MSIVRTPMLKRQTLQFVFRLLVFFIALGFYLLDKEHMFQLATQPIHLGINFLHILWAIFMIMMLAHLFPNGRLPMAMRKSCPQNYAEVKDYREIDLLRFVQQQNLRAWTVMLVWLFVNGVIGLLYLMDILDNADLLMLTVFYYLCDYICILFFCPFQTGIMKNKCCVNCRIYDWGHFMMFTPMLFIRDFFSWSLFFTSAVVLIHWEVIYAKQPERFWSGSNKTLQCAHCQDKTCQYKRAITRAVTRKEGPHYD
ncbi:MAG: hypothetical protein J6A26_05285 [Oscillospiraceae bacterium]|nr:hypothetical protein [Oscillospiraceae bacterium]